MKTYIEQNKILKEHFNLIVEIPYGTPEGMYLIPDWHKVAKTYPEALQKVLDAIKSTRPFYNWRERQIDNEHICRLNSTVIPEILSCQLGEKHKGKSVETVRKEVEPNEILLGAYEVGIILLTHPDTLKSYDDLWIDCPGDKVDVPESVVRFGGAPFLKFLVGVVEFGTDWVSSTHGCYGSASGFVPQVKLAPRTLDTVESLNLAIETVRKAGHTVILNKNWYITGQGHVMEMGESNKSKGRKAFLGSYESKEKAEEVRDLIKQTYGQN